MFPFSTGSEISIGFSDRSRQESISSLAKKPPPSPVTPTVEAPDNVCCLVLFCQIHKRIAIKRNLAKGYFLPYISFRVNDSWKNVTSYLIKCTLERIWGRNHNVQCTHAEMIDIYRVQLPKTREYYTRITVLTRMVLHDGFDSPTASTSMKPKSNISKSSYDRFTETNKPKYEVSQRSEACCCASSLSSSIIWMGIDDLNNCFNNKFLGPEPLLFYYLVQETDQEKFEMKKNFSEFGLKDCLKFILCKYGFSKEKKLLEEAKYTKWAVLRLFNEYITHCYPSRYMTYNSFKSFFIKINWHAEDVIFQLIFKALNYRNTNFICFEELLLGLAVMDTGTPHVGPLLELRLGYIFRFYDSNSDNRLNMPELLQMTNDIMHKNRDSDFLKTNSVDEVAKKLITYFTNYCASNDKEANLGLTYEKFNSIALQNKVFCELTSSIFRAPFPILLIISTKFDYDLNSAIPINTLLQALVFEPKYTKSCQVCRKTRFHISAHCIRMSTNGEILDASNLEVLQLPEKTPFMIEVKSSDCIMLANDIINRITRVGLQIFYPTNGEKSFRSSDDKTLMKNLYFVNRAQHHETIKKILYRVKEIVSHEDKIVSVKAPCYVISSLHGNLKDLLIYSHLLWKSSPFINQATYIFLGNFIDCQQWSVECLTYLCCMKILAPQRFIILRGIQEVREHQKSTNFYNEFLRDYKLELWNLINDLFDLLPLGAVIEDKIFCSTSGFPRTKKSLQSLNVTLQDMITNPLDIYCVNDILSKEFFENNIDKNLDEEFRHFCIINRICYMIRNHSNHNTTAPSLQPMLSSKFYCNNRLLSLFSGSNLQKINENTTSSVAFVSRDQIRLIRVETFLRIWPTLFEPKQ